MTRGRTNLFLLVALLVVGLTAACSGSRQYPEEPVAQGRAMPAGEPDVLVEFTAGPAITADDLGDVDWNNEIDLEISWNSDVATIRRAAACGDECASVATLTVRDRPGELPEFISFERRNLDFESDNTTWVSSGRLAISAWDLDGVIAGRLLDDSGRERMIFWFDS